jgi:uncharacterized repeat protein (TIGR01451 family)
MKSFLSKFKQVGLACVAFGAIAVSQQALAGGTASNTTISNTATVNYQVGGVAQPIVQSSPTGNTTSTGTATTFLVDKKIDLTVQEVSGNATANVAPGSLNNVTMFFVRNDGNDPQGFIFASADMPNGGVLFSATDNQDMTNRRVFVESTACTGIAQAGSLSFLLGTDSATTVPTLNADACAFVYIVADALAAATNGQVANVQLTATVRVPTSLAALTETTTADTVGVDVVFADSGRDAAGSALDQYLISSAALSVAKTSTLISDPINGTAGPGIFPKAIPLAVVEYGITLTNTGSVPATVVTITDSVPANTTLANGTYNAGASNVRISVGAGKTFCQAEAGGTDTNADGCFVTGGGVLSVGAPALASVATGVGNAVTVRFRVTIN